MLLGEGLENVFARHHRLAEAVASSGAFSIADIAVASPFVNFAMGGESIDAARWPVLADYVARIHGRPSYKATIESEG